MKLGVKIALPTPGRGLVFAVLLSWGVGLLCLDCGAEVETKARVPIVAQATDCNPSVRPPDDAVVTVLAPKTSVVVREPLPIDGYTCYRVELEDGRQGWVPYSAEYMAPNGYRLGVRKFF